MAAVDSDAHTVRCHKCGTPVSAQFAPSIDVSARGEPYPDFQYYCDEHAPLVSEMV